MVCFTYFFFKNLTWIAEYVWDIFFFNLHLSNAVNDSNAWFSFSCPLHLLFVFSINNVKNRRKQFSYWAVQCRSSQSKKKSASSKQYTYKHQRHIDCRHAHNYGCNCRWYGYAYAYGDCHLAFGYHIIAALYPSQHLNTFLCLCGHVLLLNAFHWELSHITSPPHRLFRGADDARLLFHRLNLTLALWGRGCQESKNLFSHSLFAGSSLS